MSHLSRVLSFLEIQKCPIKKIPFNNLNKKEINFVFYFIENNKDLSDSDFKGKAHYLFIDDKKKYPHHIDIIEVLMSICVNT
jgi:hypothetical protein